METGYIAAFTAGFLGGFGHCIGMCGPIVASYALHHPSSTQPVRRLAPHILYNAGRMTTYSFIGALAGLGGSLVNVAGQIAGLQNLVAVLAGLFMVFMGLNISGILGNAAWLEKHGTKILNAGRFFSQERSVWRYYPLGALFGFLPCGLSYTAFISAAGTGTLISGMLITLSFGLGTLPSLVLFGMTASFLSVHIRGLLYRTSGFIIVVMGILYLLKGMKLYA